MRWLAGETQSYAGLEANTVWQLTEGDPGAQRLSSAETLSDKERIIAFWDKHRAAMRAISWPGAHRRCGRGSRLVAQPIPMSSGLGRRTACRYDGTERRSPGRAGGSA